MAPTTFVSLMTCGDPMKILGTGKIGRQYRTVLTPIVDPLGLEIGDFIKFVQRDNGEIVIQKVSA